MRLKTTIILLAILAAVILYIRFYEHKQPGTQEALEKSKDVFDVKSDDVTSLIVSSGSAELSMRKADGRDWEITNPIRWRADSGTVNRLLSDIEFLKCDSRFAPPKGEALDLASYGLDKPELALRFTERGREHSLSLGSKRGLDGKLFARADNVDEVFILGPAALSSATVSFRDFRDKTALEFDNTKVKGLELDRKDGKLAFKLDGRQWLFTEPVAFRAGKVQVESLINDIAALKVKDWVEDAAGDLAKYNLSEPVVVARLDVGVDEKPTILFGKPNEVSPSERYAKIGGSNLVFTVRESVVADLEKPYSDLRDRTLVHVAPQQVRELSFSSGDSLLALTNRGSIESENWWIEKPAEMAADSDSVTQFLSKLGQVELEEFVSDKPEDLAAYGLASPSAVITLALREGEGEKGKVEILLGAADPSSKRVYAKRSDEPSVYAMKSDEMSLLRPSYLTFRTKQLLTLSSLDMGRVTIYRDGKKFLCESQDGGNWLLKEPFEVAANSVNVKAAINRIATLKAERFISDSVADWSQYGLAEPELRALFEFRQKEGEQAEGKAPVELLIGSAAEGEGQHYARFADQPLLFVLSGDIVNQLRADLIERTVMDFMTSEIRSIRIYYAAEDLEILVKQKGRGWEMVKPEEAEVDIAKLTSVTTKLSRLKCKSYLDELEQKPEDMGLDKPSVSIEVGLEGKTITLKLGNQTPDGDYYAAASSTPHYFILSKDDADTLMKKPSDLRR